MRHMNVVQLAAHLETSKPQLVDVREPWEFEICHLENSINIPMGQIPQSLSTFSTVPESVIICHHGVRSMHIIQYLQQQGINNLINLDGGVDAWAQQVDKDMPLY